MYHRVFYRSGSDRFVLRVRALALLLCIAALIMAGRLYYLQVIHGEEYARRAQAQAVVTKDPLLNRGSIYFSGKDGERILAATLSPPAQVQDNSTSSAPGQRYYPGGWLAAHVLGFVAYNNDSVQKGRYGLERYYEQTLSRPEGGLYANFFVELFGGVSNALRGAPQKGDLITTIEPVVQAELERTLEAYAESWHPALAGGIVMDPNTGEIIAMAALPAFSPNEFNKEKDARVFGNPMVENVYEMGSIMKPLTMAAGFDAGAVNEDSTYNDTGSVTMDGKTFSNFDGKARGTVPMQEILSQSLNVGAAHVAGKLGAEKMREYFLERYKLGQETGIDLPGEVRGLTENLQSPRQVEYATASFGQGIATTPIEMARAFATLANGGKLVVPHVVKAVEEESGLVRELGWGEPERVLKQETSVTISRMLTKVVDGPLANGAVKLRHWSVAAKTGTAQMASPDGGYYEDRYLHSFFGYFPSFDARFVVFLLAAEPRGASFSSQTWALPFKSLTQFLINYYDIPPDR
ncbi:MAG: Cell division protein FtsI [Candidatus Adlerbacteria bacterium GW2011_GWA1_54_10]|uniref:Cell division protein FtsI n=2 Tax=Candidatus Adleribacteriota TaxID=1752736 RepID=A0A0G2A4U4_9BACT|nr:MAG: Cell division protein FtsI [Candidatus Adlerbacteria bacterium GW2011_GWA1_54_10]KKW37932.1 MAG: Cell division protein FtsI [Candidatus Adlerbacteria bacterium GW2011_GWB1_54_7]